MTRTPPRRAARTRRRAPAAHTSPSSGAWLPCHAIFAATRDIVLVISASDRRVLDANAAAEAAYGYSRDELLALNADVLRAPEARGSVEDALRRAEAGGYLDETVHLRKDGTRFPVEVSAVGTDSSEGRVVVAIVRDASARRQAEQALRESQRMLVTLMSNLPGMAYRCANDPEWTMQFVSEGVLPLTGHPPSDLVGNAKLAFANLIHPDDRDRIWNEVQTALEQGRPFELVYRIHTASGREKWVWEQGRAVAGPDGRTEALEGFITDISALRSAEQALRESEERLQQSQKMEAIGRLAGGIAHDFNNLLTAILGHSHLTLGRLRPEDPLTFSVREIQRAGERAAALTRQLLAFSRRQVLAPKVLDLGAVAASMEPLVQRLIGEDIELAIADTAALNVRADRNQLEQVILNLVVNSRDAMPTGGSIRIEIADVRLDQPVDDGHREVPPGAYVRLTVTDTGHGMTDEVMGHLFEPFFTTRPFGKGTGLGLSTVYGIVRQSHGHIAVTSAVGDGTAVAVFLPAVSEPAQAADETPAELGPAGAGETILIAEDEDAVRRLTRAVLQDHGYQVLEARSGAEALDLCERHPGEIDLLITDLVMPELGGSRLTRQAMALRPKLKVLYASGYADESATPPEGDRIAAPLLAKPFTPEVLVRKVRTLLDTD